MPPDIDIKSLLGKTEAFIQTMHHVAMDLNLKPAKDSHIITCIKYSGLLQMRKEFLTQLTNSVITYVYSKGKQTAIVDELTTGDTPLDQAGAFTGLFQQATSYFRPSDIKGQFSELLLFNLLQHHFHAIPVVRKMTITTNPALERNGADAMHLGKDDDGSYVIYIGEAKTYTSRFKAAFKAAISSIITAHAEHRSELQLYQYEEYLEEPVKVLIKDYLKGKIQLPVRLVIIISYCSDVTPSKTSMEEFIKHYIDDAIAECKKIKDADYEGINEALLSELHYLIFPVDELEKLLGDFRTKLGIPA